MDEEIRVKEETKPEFPQVLYVYASNHSKGQMFIANPEQMSSLEGYRAAVYDLRGMGTIRPMLDLDKGT